MSQNSILVRNVSHLTDARYFAAMEVDWISMELTEDPLSFSKWHTLREWISGVKIAAELETNDESLIARTIIDAKPDGIITKYMDLIHLTGGIDLFIPTEKLLPRNESLLFTQIIAYDPMNLPPDIFSQEMAGHLYLENIWTPDLLLHLINDGYTGGFCFHGFDEGHLGMRDYTQMDRMIELLRD